MTNAGRLGLLVTALAVSIVAVLWSTRRATSVVARQSVVPGAERASSELAPKPERSTAENGRTDTDFAFIFYWPDGSQTMTRYGSAADLLESVDLRR